LKLKRFVEVAQGADVAPFWHWWRARDRIVTRPPNISSPGDHRQIYPKQGTEGERHAACQEAVPDIASLDAVHRTGSSAFGGPGPDCDGDGHPDRSRYADPDSVTERQDHDLSQGQEDE
jgi:hypothetical protein